MDIQPAGNEIRFAYQHNDLPYVGARVFDGRRLAGRAARRRDRSRPAARSEPCASTFEAHVIRAVGGEMADVEERTAFLERWRNSFTSDSNRRATGLLDQTIAGNIRDYASFPSRRGRPGRMADASGRRAALPRALRAGRHHGRLAGRLCRLRAEPRRGAHEARPIAKRSSRRVARRGARPHSISGPPRPPRSSERESVLRPTTRTSRARSPTSSHWRISTHGPATNGAVKKHWDTARRILDWARDYGDCDRDGYLEYRTRSSKGTKNQGWKDSGDAIIYDDGRPVPPPIATCEIQGYWYAAQQLMGVLCWMTGARADARAWFGAAADLKARFNRDWWLEDERVRRAGAGSREVAGPGRNLECRPLPGHRHHRRRTRSCRRRTAVRPRHVQRMGHPHAVGRPPLLQPAELSPRHRLGGRAGDDDLRPSALRLHCARERSGARPVRSRRALPRASHSRMRGRLPACDAPRAGRLSAGQRAAALERDRVSPRPFRRWQGSFRWRRTTRSSSIPRCPTGCPSSSSRTCASAGRPPRCGSGATRADGRSFKSSTNAAPFTSSGSHRPSL